MRPRLLLPALLLAILADGLALLFGAAPPASSVAALPPPASRPVDFVRDVQPIFQGVCVSCHNGKVHKGGLRLDTRSALDTGNIVPANSADSPLVHRVAGLGPETRMPPKGAALTPKQVGLLRAWIDQGAKWPEVASASSPSGLHWAYRPLVRQTVPAVKKTTWVRNPIDAFVLAKLEARGMSPSPEADRRTLIRRLSFDLLGLPPTPEEVEAFVNDPSPDAYEKLVDRFLADPAYGERWARHWLDVVHWAETHGHDQDVPRENAWPYRDYLIASLNADKPYSKFIREQVAGDILYPDDPQGVAALGLLAAGPWDESSQQSIRDDTLDKKVAQTLDRDDMLTTVLSAFCSTTIHCARCHDHKFDPIAQKEYYALQAAFAGVDRANRVYDPDPLVHRERRALQSRLKEVQVAPIKELLSPTVAEEVAGWEKAHVAGAARWEVLQPAKVRASAGSIPTTLPDHSVKFAGPRPATDVYTVETVTPLAGITAVRLEVLTDDDLPHRGPGRQDNGNLHLNEFKVQAAPRAGPGEGKAVALVGPVADFDQAGWTVAMAIDGNPKTAWGIYPAVGKPHHAVFPFREPVGGPGGTKFTFTLEQTHGAGHLIGRLRLSVTTSPSPRNLAPLPASVTAIVDTPPSKRSDAQKADLARFVLTRQVEGRLAKLPAPGLVYAGASDFQPRENFKPARGCRPVFVLKRGDINHPLAPAVPGALSCLPGLPAKLEVKRPDDEGERRAALARWLSDGRNALTWRSIANRVWHYHFGRGIVSTPGDLGKMGALPTHAELLDWLALELRDGLPGGDEERGSLKALHRLIVLSSTYRQSSTQREDDAKTDGDNLLLWRMNVLRLDAECVRDAVLAVSGKLDRKMGGPSVKHFIQSPGIHVTPKVDYESFDMDAPGAHRRSVYRFVFRTLPDPFMDALDCPDASQFAPVRSNSVTPLQALALLNDRFMVRQAEHFAERVRQAGPDVGQQVRRAFSLALGRAATPREAELLTRYAERHGLVNACRVILNTNEFVFVP